VPSVSPDSDVRYRQAIQRVLICGLVVAALLLGSRAPWAWALNALIVTAMLTLWFLRAGARGALTLRRTVLDRAILSLLWLAVASTFTSIYRYASVLEVARILLYVTLYYVIVNNFAGRNAVRASLRWLVVFGAVLSTYGIYEVTSGSEQVFWLAKTTSRGAVSGTFADAATFGGFLTLITPLGAGEMLDHLWYRRWAPAAIFSVCTAVAFAGLIGTFNRSSWIGTTAAFVIMTVIALYRYPTREEYRRGVVVAALAVACIVAGTVSRPVVDRLLAAFGGNGASAETRYEYFLSSVEMVRDRPVLGFGPGTFQYAWRRYRLATPQSVSGDAVYAHNEYAQYGAEMGIIAPFLIVWLLSAHLRRGLRPPSQSPIDWTAAALTASPVGLAVANITYFHWHMPANAELFWAILGLGQVWISHGRNSV
jgi:putative inorganic carbon (HCO3(-)) transporter